MAHLTCPVCKYEAKDQADYKDHMSRSMDTAHRALMKEKGMNVVDDAVDAVKDAYHNIKDKVQEVV